MNYNNIDMKRKFTSFFIFIFSIIFIAGCTVNNVSIDDEIGDIFKEKNVEGTFGIFDNSRGKFTIYNLDRFKVPYSPGATFNIFNALVAIHVGRIPDVKGLIDAQVEPEAHQEISLSDAFKQSSNEHFKALARKIGRDTMKTWVDSVKYGNMKLGKTVDQFWSDNSILISADEQLGFMKRLYFKQLPFRASVQEEVKKLLIIENNAQFQLAYQLGTSTDKGKKLYWVMGWIEENRHVYPFVLNFSSSTESDSKKLSKEITENILTYVGFFKGKM
jgi:beta-lactamase class D